LAAGFTEQMFSPGLCRRRSAAGAALNACKPHGFIRGGGRWLFCPAFMGFLRLYGSPGVGGRSAGPRSGASSCSSASGICFLGHPSRSAPELTVAVPRATKRVWSACCTSLAQCDGLIACWGGVAGTMQSRLQSSRVGRKGRGVLQAEGIPAVGFWLLLLRGGGSLLSRSRQH